MSAVNLGDDEGWAEAKPKEGVATKTTGYCAPVKSPFKIMQVGIASVLEVNLDVNQMVRAESNALITALPAKVTISASATGGLLQAASRALAGESFFLQEMTANEDGVLLELAPKAFHGLAEVSLGEGDRQGYYVRQDGFFASEPTVECSGTVGGAKEYMAQSLVLLQVTGKGHFVVEAFGGVKKLHIAKGQTAIVDNSHLVAWPVNARYEVRQASSSFLDSVASGEWAVLKFKGPCDLYVSYAREDTVEGRVKHPQQQQRQGNDMSNFVSSFLNGGGARGAVGQFNVIEQTVVAVFKCVMVFVVFFSILFVLLPRLFA